MFWTHCAFLWALFGEHCPHYKGVIALARLVDAQKRNTRGYTPAFCARVTFWILVEGWDFFATEVTPSAWRSGFPNMPVDMLPTLLDKLRTFDVGQRGGVTFPTQWIPKGRNGWRGGGADGGGAYVAPGGPSCTGQRARRSIGRGTPCTAPQTQ